MRHDARPRSSGDGPPFDVKSFVEEVRQSDYYAYVRELGPLVTGKRVKDCETGPSGYLLHFDDGSWVACYVVDTTLRWLTGDAPVGPETRELLHSSAVVDGRAPLDLNVPYASEVCDIAAEVAHAKGEQVDGLAIGRRSFSLVFPDGHELDANIRFLPGGRPVLRVFWEQW